MADTIARASLGLDVADGDLVAGLSKAGGKISGFMKGTEGKIGSGMGGMSKTIGGLMEGGIGKGIGAIGARLGALGGPIGMAVGVGVGIVAGAVSDRLDQAMEDFGKLASIGKNAKSLGIDVTQFQVLSKLFQKAGIDADGFTKILAKMGGKVEDALAGNKGNRDLLKSIGIDPESLRGLSADEVFKRIAQGISELKSPAAQASAAMKLFEEEGLKLLPIFQGGAAAIDQFGKTQQKMGTVFSASEIKMAADAKKAWGGAVKQLQDIYESIKMRLSIVFAPMITAAGKVLGKITEKLTPVFDWIQRAITGAMDIIQPLFESIYEAIAGAIDYVSDWATSFFDVGDVFGTVQDAIQSGLRAIGIVAAYVWDIFKVGIGVISIAVGTLIKVFGDLVQLLGEALALAKNLPDAVRPEWLDGMIDGVNEFGQGISKVGKDAKDWGFGTFSNFGKSADDINAYFDKIKARGKLNREKAEKDDKDGVKGIGSGSDKKTEPLKYMGVEAAFQGSKEAAKMAAAFKFRGLTGDGDVAKQQLQEEKKQTGWLRDILTEIKNKPEQEAI